MNKSLLTGLYRVYIVLVAGPLFVVLTILCSLVTSVSSMLGATRFVPYIAGKIWSKLTLWLYLCPVTVNGKEYLKKDESYIVTPNHTSAFDIYLMYGYFDRPFKWVMKGSLRKIPFVGWACENAGFIFVNLAKPLEVVHYSEVALKDDYSLMIFPEGTRSSDGKLGRVKRGAFRIAKDCEVPILPAKIDGAYEVLPKGAFWPHPHRLTLTYFPPLYPRDFLDDKGEYDMNAVQSQVVKLLES